MSFFCMLEAQPMTTFAQREENDKRPLRPSPSSKASRVDPESPAGKG